MSKSVSQLSKNAPSASDNVDTGSLDQWLGGLTFEQAYQQYEEQGYILFKDVMDADGVQQVRDALDPFLTNTGRNDFEGFQTNRVYSLLAKATSLFSKMGTHPLALPCDERHMRDPCVRSSLWAMQ